MDSQIKQLLRFRGTYLIDLAIGAARKAGIDQPLVILGAYSEQILKESQTIQQCRTILNPYWQQGLSTSIIAALPHLSPHEGVIFQLCDQPLVSSKLIHDMAHRFLEFNPDILYPEYQKQRGNPVIIHHRLFSRLMENSGDKGARFLFSDPSIHKHAYQTEDNSCLVDIDTMEEYQKITGEN